MTRRLPFLAVVLFSCNTEVTSSPEPPARQPLASKSVPAAAQTSAAPAPSDGHAAECGQHSSECGEAKPAGCECGAASAASDRTEQAKDPATGQTMLVVGSPLHGAKRVSVDDLVSNPEPYVGKPIRVEGRVSAMCHHRRAWFAVQETEGQGKYVRVIAAPAFLVPPQSIGKTARTEGVVEWVEVPAAMARHYEQDHQLGPAPARQVVIRATGAELI